MTAVVLIGGWACSLLLLSRLAAARESAARVAHEVRGPLTAAMLALHGVDGPAERLGALAAQLERAQRALDDMSGDARDRMEPVAAAALMAAVAEAWRPVAAARGRALEVAPARAGMAVLADRVRIAQAVGNLVDNALEHGDGTVSVRARAVGGRLRIEVRDQGPGLRVPMARLSRRRWAGLGRRGRGLGIAAAIAGAHGGGLSAAPAASGAALVLELPLLRPAPSAKPGDEAVDR